MESHSTMIPSIHWFKEEYTQLLKSKQKTPRPLLWRLNKSGVWTVLIPFYHSIYGWHFDVLKRSKWALAIFKDGVANTLTANTLSTRTLCQIQKVWILAKPCGISRPRSNQWRIIVRVMQRNYGGSSQSGSSVKLVKANNRDKWSGREDHPNVGRYANLCRRLYRKMGQAPTSRQVRLQ